MGMQLEIILNSHSVPDSIKSFFQHLKGTFILQLFEVQIDSADILLRYSSALVQGATNVFWIDVQTNTKHFKSLFLYLLVDVALVPEQLKKIPLQTQRDLFLLLSRFIYSPFCSINGADILLRYSSALVQGATNVFWQCMHMRKLRLGKYSK